MRGDRSLTRQADRCDEEEDRAYQDRTGYELPEDLRDKKQRLEKIRATKQALEEREAELHPGQEIEDKKHKGSGRRGQSPSLAAVFQRVGACILPPAY